MYTWNKNMMGDDNEMHLRAMICDDESWIEMTQCPIQWNRLVISYAEPSGLSTGTALLIYLKDSTFVPNATETR
jgi:hypothetical protein